MCLTHWGRVTHICVSELTIIGSDNGLSPGRRQAIIWNNAGLLLIESSGTNFSEISIGIKTFLFKKMHLNMSSAKWRPFCFGLNVLIYGMYSRYRIVVVNSFRPSDAYMLQWSIPSLVHITGCRLAGAKPLSDQSWNIDNWNLRNKFQWNLKWNLYKSNQENAFVVWKMTAILSRPQCVNAARGLICWHNLRFGHA